MRTISARPTRALGVAILTAFVVNFVTPSSSALATHPEIDNGVLNCSVRGNTVTLTWNIQFFAPIGGWVVSRDGEAIARLAPEASSYVDANVASGEHFYELDVINLDANTATGELSTLGRCSVVVGDFGMKCEVDGRNVHLQWGPILIDVHFERFVISRNGIAIAELPPDVLEYTDTVRAPGTYRYVVTAEHSPGHGFLVGACSVRVPNVGLICEVDPPLVKLDWSGAILPAVVISQFVVVRDRERIAATREYGYVDEPGPGEHHYIVYAIWGGLSPDVLTDASLAEDDTVVSRSFIVGECTILMPHSDVPPPEELTCVDIDDPDDPRAIELASLDILLRAHDVLLVWQKPVEYDRVVITRNDEVVASIPGSQFYYIDRDVAPGVYDYGVSGIVGNRASDPAVCHVEIPRPPLPPPTNLTCEYVDGVRDPAVGDVASGFVLMRWSNGAPYEWIVIVRNGERIARIPGNAESYRDGDPVPGASKYEVFGVVRLRRSESATCEVRVPPSEVPPVRDLTCVVISPGPVPVPVDPAVGGVQAGGNVDLEEEDDSSFAAPGVFLHWVNGAAYDRVLIRRNGTLIATLPGNAVSYHDIFTSNAISVVLRYEVVGVIGGRESAPAVCEVKIEPTVPPAPRDLECAVALPQEGDPNVAGEPDVLHSLVAMSWRNPVRYAAIVVSRDGADLARLSGDSMFYRDINPPQGEHVYGVRGFNANGVSSRVTECRVVVPPTIVPPVQELRCVAVDTNAQGPTAALTWRNPVKYDRIVIARNDEELAVIDGSSTQYNDLGLEPGVYKYDVIGVVGNQRSRPAQCSVVIEGPAPRNLLYFSSGLFTQDAEAAPVALSGRGHVSCMASNHDPIQGWSFGVCSDPAVLQVEEASTEGTETARLNDGEGPSFLIIREFEGGVIMGVVIDDMDATDTLPPATDHRILDIKYSGGPDAVPGETHRVDYCDTLNEPPVAVLYVIGGFGVTPDTRPGFVTLPEPIRPGFVRGDSNSDEKVDMSDAVFTLWFLFNGGRTPGCLDAGDANGDDQLDIADSVYTLQYKFSGGPPPRAPFPNCGPAEFALGCEEPVCP